MFKRIKPILPQGSGGSGEGGLPVGTTTDQIPEGIVNLYFSGKNTDDLAEGLINLYFTQEERNKLEGLGPGGGTSNHNELTNLQGGDSTSQEFYHLTERKYNDLFPFTMNFNTSDWIGPNIGYYTLTVLHNLDSQLIETEVWDNGNTPIIIERLIVDNNTITLRVPSNPDLRFSGLVWIKTT